MDALGVKRASFGGLSIGGATAFGLVQKHPGRIDKVIVCDHPCQSTPAGSKQWEERIAIAQLRGMGDLVEPTVGRWFPPDILTANPPYVDKVRQMIRTTPVNGFIGCAAALTDHDFASKAASVTHPVLFMVGEKDGGGAMPAAMRKLAEAVKGSRYVELPGAGHISNLDQRERFTGAIRDFLNAA
jgi:3-oxoadipate enol-lactonase